MGSLSHTTAPGAAASALASALILVTIQALSASAQSINQIVVSPSDTLGQGYWVTWTTPGTGSNQVLLTNQATRAASSCQATAASYTTKNNYYTSGVIHKANCNGLTPSTNYTYTLTYGTSIKVGWFVTSPPLGAPVTLAFLGDHGTSSNSLSTLRKVSGARPHGIALVGDMSYANGEQSVWDSWQKTWSANAAQFPLHFCYGNHESKEQEPDGFLAVDSRLAGPQAASGASAAGNAVSSTNVGMVHLVSLNCYTDYSAQATWLRNDLAAVNRALTPFVVVIVHCPWYNTFSSHYLEGEGMRAALEPILRSVSLGAGVKPVDLVVSGHVHTYERFTGTYQYKKDPCGPAYVTVGTGGISLYTQTKVSTSLSLIRSASYGYGMLQVINATTAVWTWQKNSGTSPSDKVFITSHATLTTCSSYPAGTNPTVGTAYYSRPPWP